METPHLDNLINDLKAYDRNDMLSDDGRNQLNEYEAIKQQLILSGVVKSLPSKEVIISEAVKYQDEFLDDPHSIADEAFIEGCNFILTALQEEKVIR